MNASRMIINLARRSYATRIRKTGRKQQANPGIQNRLNVLEEDEDKDFESLEESNFGEEEPDFSRVGDSYTAHKRELNRAKETLRLRIVARKYFKIHEPNLLTFMEKEQISYLNSTDPVEYTPEKLSESFPALPQTIRKVIKAKWKPKSADRVLKHDEQVIENWKKFKRGELEIDQKLREHLEKFKNRMIGLPNKKEVEEKLILPKPSFAEPKSRMYSGIIQSYFERQKDPNLKSISERILSCDKPPDDNHENYGNKKQFEKKYLAESYDNPDKDPVTSEIDIGGPGAIVKGKIFAERTPREKDRITVDEFFRQSVRNIGETPSLEDQVLMDTYKRRVESNMEKAEEPRQDDLSSSRKFDPRFKGENSVTLLKESKLQTEVEEDKSLGIVDESTDVSKQFGLETYVKSWEKKVCEEMYPESIKIPKNKYQRGKTYQLRDCYYDDDGKFLYRVPGLKT